MMRSDQEAGVALPTALLAMLVLLMLGGLFVAYAAPQQQVTARSQSFETGLHVAESSAELALASLADPDQPQRPFEAPTPAPADVPGARTWAVNQALSRIDATCSRFQRTAGGDGIAVVDATTGTVYGVSFLPSCQSRTTTRVMRVNYSVNPLVPLTGSVGILTGGDLYFDAGNTRILAGGLHANGNIMGAPSSVVGGYSAGGTCTTPCIANSPPKRIQNFTARAFWDVRGERTTNPTNDPFYELCNDGLIRVSAPAAPEPCHASSPVTTLANWSWAAATSGHGGGTWTWTSNAGPPPGQYYAYRSNMVNRMNNGNGNSSRVSFFAEADRSHVTNSRGNLSGSVTFTSNPKLFPSWPGVGIIADVDVMIQRNLAADGQATLVFAREQFRIDFNGKYDRLLFMACDQSLASATFKAEDPYCVADPAARSSVNSPIHESRITQNAEFTNPLDGTVVVPNLGITGVSDWEILPG
jgi:Tfp pilus assembly protein PilV